MEHGGIGTELARATFSGWITLVCSGKEREEVGRFVLVNRRFGGWFFGHECVRAWYNCSPHYRSTSTYLDN